MQKLLIVGLLSLCALEASAWGDRCKYERIIEREVSVDQLEMLKVSAGAGELHIAGDDRDRVLIKAKLCAENEDVLSKMDVISEAESDTMSVETVFPERGWLKRDDGYAYIDLELEVPSDMNLIVRDSSGEASVQGVASLDMTDSSGELEIEEIDGHVTVVDSSGRLSIEEVNGDVEITDSSGAIGVKDIAGDLIIEADSSGEIVAERVAKSVLIKRDSSGAIEVDTVGGDFTVLADTSGGISHEDVSGKVSLPN